MFGPVATCIEWLIISFNGNTLYPHKMIYILKLLLRFLHRRVVRIIKFGIIMAYQAAFKLERFTLLMLRGSLMLRVFDFHVKSTWSLFRDRYFVTMDGMIECT